MKIVILDGYSVNPGDLSWKGIEKLGKLTVYERTAPEEIVNRIGDAEVVLTNKVVLSAPLLKKLPCLKYIGVLATGYNVVDLKYCSENDIVVTNIPAYSTDSVAQMVFAHLLNITLHVQHHNLQVHGGRWTNSKDFCFWDYPLTELAGLKMGIVGLGAIGMAVARIALAFNMQVIAVTSKQQQDLPAGITKVNMEQLFAESDVLSLHCPLKDDTLNMVNADRLKTMKRNAILINTGRGPLVNDRDLAFALKTGIIAAAAVDVMTKEPPTADNPLLSCPNCFITPHIAWASTAARKRLMQIAEDNIRAFQKGNVINKVN